MNFFWNKNISLFCERFPLLAEKLNITKDLNPLEFEFYGISESKTGDLTAKENGIFLHSSYNPRREAENSIKSLRKENICGAVFFSGGLGYAPLCYAENFPDDTIILAEPDVNHFLAFLKFIDLEKLFLHKNLIFAIETDAETIITLMEKTCGVEKFAVFKNAAQSAHEKEYFDELEHSIKNAAEKKRVNASTTEKFASLWKKNTFLNAGQIFLRKGIKTLEKKCPPEIPAVILAGGPTLSKILPFLNEIKKRALLIACDTTLGACLSQNVEPDFLVITDPQYFAYRHIAEKHSPSSVVVTECAVYPAVFHFDCRAILLCSSLYPFGNFFESHTEFKGLLNSGGSVATTSWDFARFTGCREIFCAGLDLGYPLLQTHTRGSQFEENAHKTSTRLESAEKKLTSLLFHANARTGKNYAGEKILTDDKMLLFASWFSSNSKKYSEVRSFSFSEDSLSIEGFSVMNVSEFLKRREIQKEKSEFLKNIPNDTESDLTATGKHVNLENLKKEFEKQFGKIR